MKSTKKVSLKSNFKKVSLKRNRKSESIKFFPNHFFNNEDLINPNLNRKSFMIRIRKSDDDNVKFEQFLLKLNFYDQLKSFKFYFTHNNPERICRIFNNFFEKKRKLLAHESFFRRTKKNKKSKATK